MPSFSTRVDFMDRRLERFVVPPWHEFALHDLPEHPSGEVRAERALVRPHDRDFDVLVRPGHAPQEEIDGPSARNEPPPIEFSHPVGDVHRLFEGGHVRRPPQAWGQASPLLHGLVSSANSNSSNGIHREETAPSWLRLLYSENLLLRARRLAY